MAVKNGKLLYIPNKISYNLVMLTLILNTVYSLAVINRMNVSPALFFEIMFAIVFTLFLFLMSVEVKMYSAGWSRTAVGAGIAQICRVFLIPSEITFAQPAFVFNLRVWLFIYLITGGITCLAAGIIGIRKNKLRNAVKEAQHG